MQAVGVGPGAVVAVVIMAGEVGLVGLIVPPAVKPAYIGWMAVAFPIGWLVSHIFLGIIFYVVFTGIAIIFRLVGRDSLNRRFDPAADTYWVERKPVRDPKRYLSQF